jgi:hypothetical protein
MTVDNPDYSREYEYDCGQPWLCTGGWVWLWTILTMHGRIRGLTVATEDNISFGTSEFRISPRNLGWVPPDLLKRIETLNSTQAHTTLYWCRPGRLRSVVWRLFMPHMSASQAFRLFLCIYGTGVELSPLLVQSFLNLFTSPEWQMIITVEQLVKSMSGKGNRTTWRKPAPVLLCPSGIHRSCSGIELGPPQWEAGN